ncbi:O-antigen ligase family protein [Gordonia alkanivorans]|uniref:O-antigen ligase family protein n=1 Tax=Gordonia alkanivorans TaxID=84096 RepID=UPI002447F80A|nr:O-antigen ligase family protein [Gordonia alkanivorans]MDH3009321.1 hypothetical protein [Gordonia alkanivorans]
MIAGFQGVRKSVLAVGAIAWGCAVARQNRDYVECFCVAVLSVAMFISVIFWFLFPNISLSGGSSADMYTSLFEGHRRLTGFFAGPFHVALGALVLLTWAMVRSARWPCASFVVGAIGIVAGYLSLVRTFYPALALVCVVFLLVSPTLIHAARRLAVFGAALSVGLLLSVLFDTTGRLWWVVGSLAGASEDSRFLNRIPGYWRSIELFEQSPVVGWGPGSAGDTLGAIFSSSSEHVTAHNIVLKICVEAGLAGLAAWVFLLVAILVSLRGSGARMALALCLLVALFGLGLTGSAIEALPISFFLFLIVGLSCETTSGDRSEPRIWLSSTRRAHGGA